MGTLMRRRKVGNDLRVPSHFAVEPTSKFSERPGGDDVHVLVVGDTGVGKSSLINAVLGIESAPTGVGRPVTDVTRYYRNQDLRLGMWDLPGFEHGLPETALKRLKRNLKWISSKNPTKKPNVAWFCWSASSFRVTDGHRLLFDYISSRGIPVLGVLTKAHVTGVGVGTQHLEFAQWIESANVDVFDGRVHLTAAVGDDDFDLRPLGIDELVCATQAAIASGPS